MNVLMVSLAGDTDKRTQWWHDYWRLSESARHSETINLTDDPARADIILLIAGNSVPWPQVLNNELVVAYFSKCYLFSWADKCIPRLPGVYASVESRWHMPFWERSGFYPKVFDHEWIQPSDPSTARYVYSFLGTAGNSSVRGEIMKLAGAAGALIEDTGSHIGNLIGQPSDVYAGYQRRYAASLCDSRFILCPRGVGPSSFRIFEAMKAQRVPVIISDQWVEPVGPQWERFSLRVPENAVGTIPQLLQQHVPRFNTMAELARAEWERWFSKETALDTIVHWCGQLSDTRARYGPIGYWLPYLQFLRPFFARHELIGPAYRAVVAAIQRWRLPHNA